MNAHDIAFELAGDPLARLASCKTGAFAKVMRAALREKIKEQEPLACAVSVFIKFCLPIPADWSAFKIAKAESGTEQPTPKKSEIELLTNATVDALTGAAFVDSTMLCELRSARLFDKRPRIEVIVTQWVLRFADTDDLCLGSLKMETLRKAQRKTAAYYSVRALNELLERQMAPVSVEIFRQELFWTSRKVDGSEVQTEARRLKLDHRFDGLVDIETGSIYRDGVCVTSSQLEIVSGPLKRKAKSNGANYDTDRSVNA